MKVIDILPKGAAQNVNEEQLISKMKSVDWNYEFNTNLSKLAKASKEIDVIENLVYQLWKQKPDRAINIWNTFCPDTPNNEIVTPSFLMRFQALGK
jgi:hypothetical protein